MNQQSIKQLGASIAKAVTAMGFQKQGKRMSYRHGLDIVAKLGGIKNWQAIAALKSQPKGSLAMDRQEEGCNDYTLAEGVGPVWITVKGHSVYINPTDEGVVVDVFARGAEDSGTTATTFAFDSDAEEAFCEDKQIEMDDVAVWVGLHYKVNFEAESPAKRMEWLHRYAEAHEETRDVPHKVGEAVTTNDTAAVEEEKEPAYFASLVSGDSADEPMAISLGLLREGQPFYQLQKNDELGLYTTDDAAIEAALSDAERGDKFAIEQLALASTDPLVFMLRQRRLQNQLGAGTETEAIAEVVQNHS